MSINSYTYGYNIQKSNITCFICVLCKYNKKQVKVN